MQNLKVDIVIVGAGIAGLWLLNRLSQQGFSVLMLENHSIGCGQSMHSQGIIHGGTKYALSGKLTKAASEISRMTQVWSDCLNGRGEVNLSSVNVLSPYHYLWTRSLFGAGLKSFVTSKVLASDSDVIKLKDYPEAFKVKQFHGSLCRLQETVWDVPDLIRHLAKPYVDQIIKTDENTRYQFDESGRLQHIALSGVQIEPSYTIFTAAKGNEEILKGVHDSPKMQIRPLHMVYLKAPKLPQIYAHCVDKGTSPRMTITTHFAEDGRMVWYLGGGVSETGVERDHDEQIAFAQKEIANIVPWVDLSQAEWGAFRIDRAEGATSNGKRPDVPILQHRDNFSVIWPTKLTFAPMATAQMMKHLPIQPQYPQPDCAALDKAPMGKITWN